jgi:hypothetical protein
MTVCLRQPLPAVLLVETVCIPSLFCFRIVHRGFPPPARLPDDLLMQNPPNPQNDKNSQIRRLVAFYLAVSIFFRIFA